VSKSKSKSRSKTGDDNGNGYVGVGRVGVASNLPPSALSKPKKTVRKITLFA
jgi:hypothetical protein